MGILISKIKSSLTKDKYINPDIVTVNESNSLGPVRRRNSLAYNISQFVEFEGDDFQSLVDDVKKAMPPAGKRLRITKLSKVADTIIQGNYHALKNEVVVNYKTINKSFPDRHLNYTILHFCCQMGYYYMLQFLMNPTNHSEFDDTVLAINCRNDKNRTPLHLCFYPPTATFLGLKFGVDSDGNPISEMPDDCETEDNWIKPGGPKQREQCVKLLLKHGALVNDPDFHGFTPLHYACMWGWSGIVKALIQEHADVNSQTVIGRTPLMYAVQYMHDKVVEILCNNKECIVNHNDTEGYTALILAAELGQGSFFMMDTLLRAGAVPDASNYKKKTALSIACAAQNVEQVNLLLDFKVNRRPSAINLLQGDAAATISKRMLDDDMKIIEELERAKKEEAAQAKKEEEESFKLQYASTRTKSPWGQWVPYYDKASKNNRIFYYNLISRRSQWEKPSDYVYDKTYVPKDATYGMSFYH